MSNKSSQSYFIWGAAGILVLMVVAIIIKALTQSPSVVSLDTTKVSESDWTRGKKDAKVVLIEYGDFECPACRNYKSVIDQINENYADKILFVFRHFPLRDVHDNAMSSARAAEAAGLQGKFWEMHDKLYDNQDIWANRADPTSLFVSYAEALGLNADKFKTDMNSDEVIRKINDSYSAAVRLNVPGTPAFFLLGKPIPTPVNYANFKQLLDLSLAQNP